MIFNVLAMLDVAESYMSFRGKDTIRKVRQSTVERQSLALFALA